MATAQTAMNQTNAEHTTVPVNLFDFDLPAMSTYFTDIGEKPFRARQLLQWIYQRQVLEFDAMTDFSKALREKLAAKCTLALPKIVSQQLSTDGTCKWLLELVDGNCIEAVFIPEDDRGTLCVSSQVGCGLNCTFCATARQGYNRDLTVGEIISQVWVANHALQTLVPEKYDADISGRKAVTNVVMMGMGEPLLNFDNVVPAMNLMMDDFAFGLSKRRVTLSTAGMVPMMDKLNEQCPVSLAVSLHAPNDDLRDKLVPLNKKYPIAPLLEACRRYVAGRNRQRITFEYVMLKDINDSLEHAAQLAKLLKDVPAKVNLIPFNPFTGTQFERSSKQKIDAFRDFLLARDVFTVTRKTRGDDIDAACGQLAGKIEDRTNRSKRMANMKIDFHQGGKNASS